MLDFLSLTLSLSDFLSTLNEKHTNSNKQPTYDFILRFCSDCFRQLQLVVFFFLMHVLNGKSHSLLACLLSCGWMLLWALKATLTKQQRLPMMIQIVVLRNTWPLFEVNFSKDEISSIKVLLMFVGWVRFDVSDSKREWEVQSVETCENSWNCHKLFTSTQMQHSDK